MKISIKLKKSEAATGDGFPIYLMAEHNGKRVQKIIGRAHAAHFSDEGRMITDEHPDYDILAPKIMDIKLRARKIVLLGVTDPAEAMSELFRADASGITVADFGAAWATEQRDLMAAYEKRGDTRNRNKISGYLKSVENAVAQFENYFPRGVAMAGLNYETLMKWRRHNEILGNSPATIHLYLRTIRMLYNKACLQHGLLDKKPFTGVFDRLKVKSYDAGKKYLEKGSLQLLEGLTLGVEQGRARDLFLLQFYFGGADLIDLYFLKKVHLRKGRVRFERGKTNTGKILDLKIHPKAQAIIDRHAAADGEFLFPWGKTTQQYENFRSKIQKLLVELQKAQAIKAAAEKNEALRIDVLPDGRNLGIKVARHTFANLAKTLMVDPDIIRELMGHQRDDVDNYYKDKFPEKMRDAALFKIIG